jgi:tRNA(adenine34) deaminase
MIARDEGSVPVGSVIVSPAGRVEGRGHNRVQLGTDPTAHAEIDAIRRTSVIWASGAPGWTLVTSAEPCLMCLGAILLLPISSLVWATDSGLESALAAVRESGFLASRLESLVVTSEPSPRHRDASRTVLLEFYARIGEPWRAARWASKKGA